MYLGAPFVPEGFDCPVFHLAEAFRENGAEHVKTYKKTAPTEEKLLEEFWAIGAPDSAFKHDFPCAAVKSTAVERHVA